MTTQEIADVKIALEKVAEFSAYPRPRTLTMKVLVPCAREHKCNEEWARICDRLESAGVLKSIKGDEGRWYTT